MGTSSMTYVFMNGSMRKSSLGNMDGYPSLTGKGLLGFVSNRKNLERLRKSLPRCRSLEREVLDEARNRGGYDWEDRFIEDHPEYLYNSALED